MAEKMKVSRRSFLKGAAVGTLSAASLAGLAACGSSASDAAATKSASDGSMATGKAYDVLGTSYSSNGRANDGAVKAATTPEEYLAAKGDGVLSAGGACDALGIAPEDFMLNVPAWLGEKPALEAEEDGSCDVLVIGAGNAGTTAALKCAESGLKVILAETQTYDEYDEYACDMAMYNSKLFLDKGTPGIDPMDIFNEYMRLYRGHAHQSIVRDFATRGGEVLDWMVDTYIPAEYTDAYAKTSNYKGNDNFSGICAGQYSFRGMTQWRDMDTNVNMWPFVIRTLHTAFEGLGGEIRWGYQGIELVGGNGEAVTGAVFKNIDGAYKQVNAKVVICCAGDFGGNPDMRLDLSDQMRNLAWSFGKDRTDVASTMGMGRDGSGIRMCLWAGATMEGGPRAGQAAGINGVPGFAFGGAWPCFGGDGKRFMNESLIKHGSNGYLDMLPADSLLVNVTDSNWETYLSYQGYGHETMDRSSDYMVEEVRENMKNYVTGSDGFDVRAFARFGKEYSKVYAADTLDELADIVGYTGEAKKNFLAEVAHYNEMCEAGKDSDWGCDPQNLFAIKDAPFFASFSKTSNQVSGGLCQHAAVCTDGSYRVLYGDKTPIEGLYAAGNNCGQRYGIQYATPTAGNSCGSALISGYCAAEHVVESLGK